MNLINSLMNRGEESLLWGHVASCRSLFTVAVTEFVNDNVVLVIFLTGVSSEQPVTKTLWRSVDWSD